MSRFMTLVVVGAAVVSSQIWAPAPRAYADATASTGGGTVSVGVSTGGTTGGAGGSNGSPVSTGPTAPTGSGGFPTPAAPICTSTILTLNNQLGPPPGVTTPGNWYSITCTDASGISTSQTLWVSSGAPAPAPAAPAVDPRSVALQAERSLSLPPPSLNFSPSTAAVVNLPTWLWIDPSIWHTYAVSATVGAVTATATATPVSVTWDMGDGGSDTCTGPGVAYQVAVPSSAQGTDCSYTYRTTSVGQPSPDGDPDHGAFTVTADVAWQVSWTAQGATGGGELPGLTTTARVPLRVIQVESVNS